MILNNKYFAEWKKSSNFVLKLNNMRYEIGDYVKIIDTNKIKKIVDVEKIQEIILYYMSDMTAYPETKVSYVDETDISPILNIYSKKILTEDRVKLMAKNMAEALKKYEI